MARPLRPPTLMARRSATWLRRAATSAGALDASVGVAREAAVLARVDGIVDRPRPASEPRALVVDERLLDLGARAHDEGPVLNDGLGDGPSLQEKELALFRAVLERRVGVGPQLDGVARGDIAPAHAQGPPAEEVQPAVRRARGARQRPGCAR